MDMTREELFRAIGEAEDAWVLAAETPPRAAKRRRWPIAVAAVLVVGLVACGVQQGWFQFLTPEQWRGSDGSSGAVATYGYSNLSDEETVTTSLYANHCRVSYTQTRLTEDSFRQKAEENGWALNWAALADAGKFSGTATPCWEASQLQIERRTARNLVLSGTPQEVPATMTGIWMEDEDTNIAVSFMLADKDDPLQLPLEEKDELVELKTTDWNEAVLVTHSRYFTKPNKETQEMKASDLLAWRPLDKTVENMIRSEDAVQEPLQGKNVDRCVLVVSFEGYTPEEALRLAQELLKSE